MGARNCLFTFRRRNTSLNRQDETEITVTSGAILAGAVVVLVLLLIGGVISPDVFVRAIGAVAGR